MARQPINLEHDGGAPPRLWLRALIHNIDTDTYSLDVRFDDVRGLVGALRMDRALIREPSRAASKLLDAGAMLPAERNAAIETVVAALSQPPIEQYSVTQRGGWHAGSYVTPTETFGEAAATLRFVGPSTTDASYGLRAGTAAQWRDDQQQPCAFSSYLTFAVSVAYGAPLLHLLAEDEGATFHLAGPSSTGKSLSGRVCESMIGRARKSDLPTYDMTARSLEEFGHSRNDAAAVIDEEGRNAGPLSKRRQQSARIAFMLAGGRGTIRSAFAAKNSGLANLTWRLFAISSGEEPLESALARRRAGEQVRHIDIPVPLPEHGGIFDLLNGDRKKGIRLAAQVEATIEQNYGEPIRPYLAALVDRRREHTIRARAVVEDFIAAIGADTDAWERRFALKFAIVAAGGVIAAELGAAPFDPDHATRCVRRIYRIARRAVFSVQECYASVLARLRRAVKDTSLFPQVKKGEILPRKLRNCAWGFRRTIDGREIIAVDPTQFEELAGSAPLADAILDEMIERRVALAAVGGKRRPQIAVQGFPRDGRSRWVCLRASAL